VGGAHPYEWRHSGGVGGGAGGTPDVWPRPGTPPPPCPCSKGALLTEDALRSGAWIPSRPSLAATDRPIPSTGRVSRWVDGPCGRPHAGLSRPLVGKYRLGQPRAAAIARRAPVACWVGRGSVRWGDRRMRDQNENREYRNTWEGRLRAARWARGGHPGQATSNANKKKQSVILTSPLGHGASAQADARAGVLSTSAGRRSREELGVALPIDRPQQR